MNDTYNMEKKMLIKKCKNYIFKRIGDHKVLEIKEENLEKIKNNEVLIEQKAIGLNYIDIYHRSGLYKLNLPSKIGLEASGIIIEKGKDVLDLNIGDRVAYVSMPVGAYCDYRIISTQNIYKIPDEISFEKAAAIMLKGLTVEYLFNRIVRLLPGDHVLFHAAAGGVGLIACQWAKSENINLIATAGNDEKCNLAYKNGAMHVINYKKNNFEKKVKEITKGIGVDVVMDSVGKDTFFSSLNSLKPLGMMISFGNSSGQVPPFDIQLLQGNGSIKITRPTLFNPFLLNKKTFQSMSHNLFEKIRKKEIEIKIGQKFDFKQIPDAHRELENRNTSGSTIISL